jgi:hypothetical protein
MPISSFSVSSPDFRAASCHFSLHSDELLPSSLFDTPVRPVFFPPGPVAKLPTHTKLTPNNKVSLYKLTVAQLLMKYPCNIVYGVLMALNCYQTPPPGTTSKPEYHPCLPFTCILIYRQSSRMETRNCTGNISSTLERRPPWWRSWQRNSRQQHHQSEYCLCQVQNVAVTNIAILQ